MKLKAVTAAKEALGEVSEKEEDIKTAQDEQFQLQVDIKGKVASLSSMTNIALMTKEQFKSIMDLLSQVEHKVEKYMEISKIIQKGSEATGAEAEKKESQTFFKTHNKKLNELRGTFLAKAPIKADVARVAQNTGQPEQSGGSDVRKHPVKIKPMDCPTWDGRYRTFPRFKKMWEENIATRHEDTALHYMLCQSLPKSILDNISTLSNSAEDIWKYLDNKFGKSDTVAREVMGELMSLDHKKLG